jgi:transposase, IS5 family
MFGVMFLKAYLGLSDEKLVDRINTNWELQMFCGRQFKDNQRVKDRNLPSRIRSYIGKHLILERFQDVIIEHWRPYLNDRHCGFADATAYESYIKHPTDEKLSWDCCIWVFESIFSLCSELGIKRPRSKYREQQKKQVVFSKLKKKTYKIKKCSRSSLLYLLNKGMGQLEEILGQYYKHIELGAIASIEAKLETVRTVHNQQEYMHENPGEYVKDRIVSLFKPYPFMK